MTDESPNPKDAVIIGAGPAGCVAAILLARGGWRVRLIEQHRFPRDKVCGECLSAMGMNVLNRIGLAERFRKLDPVRLTRTMIHAPNGSTLEMKLPEAMWGLSRLRMDQWLLEEAIGAGTELIQPSRCEEIRLFDSDRSVARVFNPCPSRWARVKNPCYDSEQQIQPRVQLAVRDLISNHQTTLDAAWVLLADGKAALSPRRPTPTADLGIKAHFENITGARDAIELFGDDGHYGGVAPIEAGRWNIAFSVPRRRVSEHNGNLDSLFDEIVSENAVLRGRFSRATRISEWLASPLPRFAVSTDWQPGVIPLGNAAAAVEPVGGEGMGLAMRSAELAATMLLSGNVNLARLQCEYKKLWRMRRLSCRTAAMLVSRPVIANLLIPLLAEFSLVPRAAMGFMGKSGSSTACGFANR